MIPRHFAITLAFFEGLVGLVFLLFFVAESQDALNRNLRDGPPAGLGLAQVVGFVSVYGIALLSVVLAGLMTSPLTRTTLLLSSVQLAGGLALLCVMKGTLLGLASLIAIPVAAASIALCMYRRREQVRLREPSIPTGHSSPRVAPRLVTVTLIALHIGVAVGLLIYALAQIFYNSQDGLSLGITSYGLALLIYTITPAFFSISIVGLLLTRHPSRAWHLAIPQFILSLPVALVFLILSAPAYVLAGLALVVISLATLFLIPRADSTPSSADLTDQVERETHATLRTQREQDAATWESPTIWTSRYLGFQLAVFFVAGIQILLAVVLAAIWYQLEHRGSPIPQGDAGTIVLSLASDQRIGLAINFAAALALGCFLLSPRPRISLVLGLLQTFIVLTLQPLGDGFGLTQIIILPLAIVSVALSIWRERLDPPGLAD